jgi:hypothetical protein
MKHLIFGIAVVTLGAISQAKAADIEIGKQKRDLNTRDP